MTRSSVPATRPQKKLELSRTSEYNQHLLKLYFGQMLLPVGVKFNGISNTIPHLCNICGSVTNVKPKTILTGRGCTVCKTSLTNLVSLNEHSKKLKEVHDGRYSMLYDIPRFVYGRNYPYKCSMCSSQMLRMPEQMESKELNCEGCTHNEKLKSTSSTTLYVERLRKLYGNKIKCVSQYSDKSLTHVCSKKHSWDATAAEMLQGRGCGKCRSSVAVKQMKPFMHLKRRFILRNENEKRALEKVREIAGGSLRNVRSALMNPVPILVGKNVPAFYVKRLNLLIDVLSFGTLRDNEKMLKKTMERAHALGYQHGFVTVHIRSSKTIVAYTETGQYFLAREKPKPDEDEWEEEPEAIPLPPAFDPADPSSIDPPF